MISTIVVSIVGGIVMIVGLFIGRDLIRKAFAEDKEFEIECGPGKFRAKVGNSKDRSDQLESVRDRNDSVQRTEQSES